MAYYPNSFGDPCMQYTRPPHILTGSQINMPPYNQVPNISTQFNQLSSETPVSKGQPGTSFPPPGHGHTAFPPPFPQHPFPSPLPTGQTFPPLPPNFNYTTPPPFPYANNAIPSQDQQVGIPPPSLGPTIVHHQSHVSSSHRNESFEGRQHTIDTVSSLINSNSNESENDNSKQIGEKRTMAWLQKIGKGKPGQKRSYKKEEMSEFKINEYMCSLKTMAELITSMSSQIEKLESSLSTAEKLTWTKDCSVFNNRKEKFITLESLLESQAVSQAEKKLSKSKNRRARIKRMNMAEREENVKMLEARQVKDQKISEWQRQIEDEMKEEKMKKERKINMDRTLAEVTKKINDANRLIETMSSVEKLRLIRRDAAEKRGDNDLGESRQNVVQKIEDMKRLVRGQLEVYKDEEQVLRDTIKSEYEESNKKKKQLQLEKEETEKRAKDRNLSLTFFGHFRDADVSDPLYPYQDFYKQAQKSLPALLQIRQDWDRHISSTESGSTIPSVWVFPCHPSSAAWASALVQEN